MQRTPGANPEMYMSTEYSEHLKGDNSVHKKDSNHETPGQREREFAGESFLPLAAKTWSIGNTANMHLMLGTKPVLEETQNASRAKLFCKMYSSILIVQVLIVA